MWELYSSGSVENLVDAVDFWLRTAREFLEQLNTHHKYKICPIPMG
jgi:hypothetical protein